MDAKILDEVQFASSTLDDWQKLTAKVLKGADFTASLVTTTDDGIQIQPLSLRKASAVAISRRTSGVSWTLTQRIDDAHSERATSQAKTDVENGANCLAFVMADSAAAYGTGLASLPVELVKSLANSSTSARVESSTATAALSLAQTLSESQASVHFGLDMFANGLQPHADGSGQHQAEFAGAAKQLVNHPAVKTIFNADGRLAHNCGASEAEELAIVAASLLENLRIMADNGVDAETVIGKTSLCVSVNQHQYLNIAKLRALRKIASLIQSTLGLTRKPMHVFAETSWRMLTSLDPETNVLRNTIATFSAGIAGADEIVVLPHTLALGLPDPLARRLARNTQLVLAQECHLGHVVDPVAGSGSLEALTSDLAAKAWGVLQVIEASGGLRAAIASGQVQDMIAKTRTDRKPAPIVGTTIYPQKTERPVAVLAPLGASNGASEMPMRRLDQINAQNGDQAQ